MSTTYPWKNRLEIRRDHPKMYTRFEIGRLTSRFETFLPAEERSSDSKPDKTQSVGSYEHRQLERTCYM